MNIQLKNTSTADTGATMLDGEFPPRGSGYPDRNEGQPAAEWAHPWELGSGWDWKPGKILLGEWKGRLLGDPDQKEVGRLGDDRHIVTIAGSRAGKSRTVLIPNLLTYPGSMIVIDPKGELANASASTRAEAFGQNVVVLDPFQTSKWQSSSYNPLAELDPKSPTFIDDVGLVADALIIDAEKDPHWTDSAKSLINAIILYVFATGSGATLSRVRRVLMGSDGPLTFDNAKGTLFTRMADVTEFGGLVALAGKSFGSKGDKEGAAILSTAREQTRFLDSLPMDAVLKDSPLRLRNLKQQPTTIFLCLPAARLATHSRWLRLIITLAVVELERDQTKPDHAVILMLEEFAALERMKVLERAAGFMAGYGVRLWTVLQNLGQLKSLYRDSWETFLGNAGIIQAFGNIDLMTTQHLSTLLGSALVLERQDVRVSGGGMDHGDIGIRESPHKVPLLEPSEIARHFARATRRQLIISPGRPPIYMERFEPK